MHLPLRIRPPRCSSHGARAPARQPCSGSFLAVINPGLRFARPPSLTVAQAKLASVPAAWRKMAMTMAARPRWRGIVGAAWGIATRRSLCAPPLEAPRAPKWRIGLKNFFELATTLPNNGVGYRFARNIWLRDGRRDTYWTVTRVRLRLEGLHGKAYGRLTWRGRESEREREIRSPRKRGWRYLLDGDGAGEQPKPPPPAPPQSTPVVG